MKVLRLLLPVLFLVVTGTLSAYDLATHARITLAAFQQSSLTTDATKVPNLGLPSLKYTQLGDFYYDVSGGQNLRRQTFGFDSDHGKFPPDGSLILQANGWLMRGAVREDDGGTVSYLNLLRRGNPPPFDDPYGRTFNRFCNHFFDPMHADSDHAFGALTDPAAWVLCGLSNDTKASAPVWASGSVGPFGFYSEDQTRRNHFSVYDAREAMWRALTGYDRTLTTKVAARGWERKGYWATTFRALGDILHLNQDMAQPQHTRNESHGVKSHYEDYIDNRAIGGSTYVETVDGQKIPRSPQPLYYLGYLIPRFSHYGKYWSTGTGSASLTGKGLADYSSRGFFTPAHNFGDTAYPSPSSDEADYISEMAVDVHGWKVEYLTGVVYDAYKGSNDRIRMTMRSSWAESLGDFHFVNLEVFDDHANLLIPRAVGYSAGLLDYFFNGRLEISLPAEGAYAVVDHSTGGGTQGFTQVLMNLKNVTPPLTEGANVYPQNMIGGQAVAVVKFHRNTCYKPDLTGEYAGDFNKIKSCRENASDKPLDEDDASESIVVSKKVPFSLDADATKFSIKFDFSSDPIPLDASDLYLQVVYRGPLGPDADSADQDVVVVGTKDISEPTYFSYFNASDYIHIGGTVYTRERVAGDQTLLAQVRPVECVTGTVGSLQLVDGCLVPFSLSMQLGFADLSDPTVRVVDLPSKRFFRFVFLTDGGPAPAGNRRGAASAFAARLQMVMTGRHPLTLLNQQSICLPLDPFDVKPGQNQLYFDSLVYDSTQTQKLRGIAGYYQVSCVIDGDGSAPGSPDDRNTAMSELKDADIQPFAVTIKGAFTGN